MVDCFHYNILKNYLLQQLNKHFETFLPSARAVWLLGGLGYVQIFLSTAVLYTHYTTYDNSIALKSTTYVCAMFQGMYYRGMYYLCVISLDDGSSCATSTFIFRFVRGGREVY